MLTATVQLGNITLLAFYASGSPEAPIIANWAFHVRFNTSSNLLSDTDFVLP
jgi:hypothetical protein